MPAGVRGFISFHIERSEIFHNARSALFHVLREQNISLYVSPSCHPERRKAYTPPAVEPVGRCVASGSTRGRDDTLARDPARLRLALLRSSTSLRYAQDDTGGFRFTKNFSDGQSDTAAHDGPIEARRAIAVALEYTVEVRDRGKADPLGNIENAVVSFKQHIFI